MTRINCIPPSELTLKHLVAEYRELPRVFTLAVKSFNKNNPTGVYMYKETPIYVIPTQPKQYTLGTGHVIFFYNKLGYLYSRYLSLVREMRHRGYNPNSDIVKSVMDSFYNIPEVLKGNWIPDDNAMAINRARIEERLKGTKTLL